jgi:hypothetical protein
MPQYNRSLQRESMRRFSARKVGGGFDALGGSFLTAGGVPAPVYGGFSDCAIPERGGALVNPPNPALAQTPMAGGGYDESPFIHASGWPALASEADLARAQTLMAGGRRRRRTRAKKSCGCMAGGKRRGSRRAAKRTRKAKKQRGGAGGFSTIGGMSIGGSGPIAVPEYASVPCDARAGTFQRGGGALSPAPFTGGNGGYAADNGFAGGACSRAPGSELPVYEATTAGFDFKPAVSGAAAYMDVNPVAARGPMTGGKRRSRRRGAKRRGTKRRGHSRKH